MALPLAVAAACAFGSSAAWAGLSVELPRTVSGTARLVTDPTAEYGAVRAEAVVGGRHWDLWAHGPEATALARLSAGRPFGIRAKSSDLRGRAAPYLRRRHITGRLEAVEIRPAGEGSPAVRVANWVRRKIEKGASHLPDPARGLFLGMVLGDDRAQDPATEQRFRAAGLSHLLVVSGQNVAFALALFAPLVARGATGTRLICTLAVLGLFGSVVRWEPSVMRAIGMAALVALTRSVGAAAQAWSLLCAAVTVLLMIDPFLAGSISFLLSVAASAGLALITPRLMNWVPGPRVLAEAFCTTLGAQIAVAPLLLIVFGAIPLMSVPANVLAAPAAGPAMTWGMAVGVPAGLIGDPVAGWLHLPTRLLVGWVDGVASLSATAGGPVLRTPGQPPRSPSGTRVVSAAGATVVIVDRPRPELAEELRTAGVTHIDLLVSVESTPRAARCALGIRRLASVRRTLGPAASHDPGSTRVSGPGTARAGPIELRLEPVGRRLRVDVSVGSKR